MFRCQDLSPNRPPHLSAFYDSYRHDGGGGATDDPALMLAVPLYAPNAIDVAGIVVPGYSLSSIRKKSSSDRSSISAPAG